MAAPALNSKTKRTPEPKQTPLLLICMNCHTFDAPKWVQMCSLAARAGLWTISARSLHTGWTDANALHPREGREREEPPTNEFRSVSLRHIPGALFGLFDAAVGQSSGHAPRCIGSGGAGVQQRDKSHFLLARAGRVSWRCCIGRRWAGTPH